MGVFGLWKCVNQIAEQVDLECLRGQVIAIDTTNLLYKYEFMDTMDGEEAVASDRCHIKGLFDTICILLSFGIKPIFVFDGRSPEVKRLTLKRRNPKKRENDRAKYDPRDLIKREENKRKNGDKKSWKEPKERRSQRKAISNHESSQKEALHHENIPDSYAESESIAKLSKPHKKILSSGADFIVQGVPFSKETKKENKKKTRSTKVLTESLHINSVTTHSTQTSHVLKDLDDTRNGVGSLSIVPDDITQTTADCSEVENVVNRKEGATMKVAEQVRGQKVDKHGSGAVSDEDVRVSIENILYTSSDITVSLSSDTHKLCKAGVSDPLGSDEDVSSSTTQVGYQREIPDLQSPRLSNLERFLKQDKAKKKKFQWQRDDFLSDTPKAKSDPSIPGPQISPFEPGLGDLCVEFAPSEVKDVRVRTFEIDDDVFQDSFELIRYFGIPYLRSPSEAEAQCAILEELGFTQGTITEDGDIWLFGGKTVYRTLSNPSRKVHRYTASNIESKLGLTRQRMIWLAMLCGCSYTDGIKGITFDKAMVIIEKFEGEDFQRLKNLKEWWSTDENDVERLSCLCKLREPDEIQALRKLKIPEDFPNEDVYRAFKEPQVNTELRPFSWQKPYEVLIKSLLQNKSDLSSKEIYIALQMVKGIIKKKNVDDILPDYFFDIKTPDEKISQIMFEEAKEPNWAPVEFESSSNA